MQSSGWRQSRTSRTADLSCFRSRGAGETENLARWYSIIRVELAYSSPIPLQIQQPRQPWHLPHPIGASTIYQVRLLPQASFFRMIPTSFLAQVVGSDQNPISMPILDRFFSCGLGLFSRFDLDQTGIDTSQSGSRFRFPYPKQILGQV